MDDLVDGGRADTGVGHRIRVTRAGADHDPFSRRWSAAARAELTGTLRIGAFPTAVRTILSPALVALSRDHPGLELMVTELDPATVPAALRAETLDVALVQDYDYVPAEPDPALDGEPLLEETVYLAALDGGPLEARHDARWIVGTPGTLCHTMTVRACQAAGFTPRIRHHADDFGTVLALVAAGRGVALVPELGLLTPPANVVLTALPTRRRTRLAYRRAPESTPPWRPPARPCAPRSRGEDRDLNGEPLARGARHRTRQVRDLI